MFDDNEVTQQYQRKQQTGGSGNKWRVNTEDTRDYLENRLKGKAKVEKEFNVYNLIKKEKDEEEVLTQFLAENHSKAKKAADEFAKNNNLTPDMIKWEFTGNTEERFVEMQVQEQLLPDDVVDKILTPVEPIFSRQGYLTNYDEEDILDALFYASISVRKKLSLLAIERDDIDHTNFDLVINMIKQMVLLVLKAAEGGKTAEQISEATQEKMVTYTDDEDKLMAMS